MKKFNITKQLIQDIFQKNNVVFTNLKSFEDVFEIEKIAWQSLFNDLGIFANSQELKNLAKAIREVFIDENGNFTKVESFSFAPNFQFENKSPENPELEKIYIEYWKNKKFGM